MRQNEAPNKTSAFRCTVAASKYLPTRTNHLFFRILRGKLTIELSNLGTLTCYRVLGCAAEKKHHLDYWLVRVVATNLRHRNSDLDDEKNVARSSARHSFALAFVFPFVCLCTNFETRPYTVAAPPLVVGIAFTAVVVLVLAVSGVIDCIHLCRVRYSRTIFHPCSSSLMGNLIHSV